MVINTIKQSITEIRERNKRHQELNEKFSKLTLEQKEKVLKNEKSRH